MRQIKDGKDWIIAAFVSVLFVGYAPFMSGTVGSVPGAVVAFWLGDRPIVLLGLAVVLFAMGALASSRGEHIFGRKDPSEVVIDEFVGMLVAFLWLPVTWQSLVAAFLLFRLFDIWKPFPAGRFEKLSGGLGIMADDLVAGIYANLTYHILFFLLKS
jgi:phosphatidylglycerophosphatase A